MSESTLSCPACAATFDVPAVFSNCHACQTEARYFAFKCPRCEDHSEVRVEGDVVLIGGPDGFPEPSFREHARTHAPGIEVSWERNAAVVTIGDRRWSFRPSYYRH